MLYPLDCDIHTPLLPTPEQEVLFETHDLSQS